jgi:methyl-accepting chemotaxis protein
MGFLKSISIKAKIISLAGAAIIGFVVSLAVNTGINSANSERMQKVRDVYFPVVQKSDANLVKLNQIEALLNTAVATGEEEFIDSAEGLKAEIRTNLNDVVGLWVERSNDTQLVLKQFNRYYSSAHEVSAGMLSGTLDMSLMGSKIEAMNSGLETVRSSMQKSSDGALSEFNLTVEASNAAAKNALTLGVTVTGVTVAILLLLSWSMVSSIGIALNSLLRSLKDIASGDGDLTKRI